MNKYKSDDYKLSAVKYYLNHNDSMDKVCGIFDCKKSTLKGWIDRYKTTKNISRKNRTPISYKINKDQVKTAVNMIDKNEQLTMDELLSSMKQKYNDFDITPQHLGRVIRANNRTRKRTRHQHYPKERRKQLTDKNKEMEAFYNEVRKYPIDKIICLDETSIGSHLKPSYSRCYIGKRCIIKTNNNFVFRSFTLLVAINNSKCVGKSFYEKGGTTKERMVEFIETQIAPKYKNHLIILDNARSHNNDMVREAIIKSGNQYLFTIPYSPITNAIEMYFNQIKTYIKKNRDVYTFAGLEENIDKAIDRVKPENYKNYFQYAYGVKDDITYKRKPGDWEQRKQMKYKEPTLGKGIRTLFRKNNYNVFLVDEFRSSCKCSKCDGGICEKFMVREHPNKKKNKDELQLIHGLLHCKNGCGSWNRDRNGSSNIYKIAKNAINNIDRPSYLCRETSNQSTSTSAYNQTLRRYEKT